MKLTITGKHLEITDGIKDHLDQKLKKMILDLEDHVDTHIILETEKNRQIAEIILKTKGHTFHVKESTQDLYTAIDHSVSKMEKQLRKHKDKTLSLKAKRNSSIKEKTQSNPL